jgi:tetratricopeptide (TPR) repeat protein
MHKPHLLVDFLNFIEISRLVKLMNDIRIQNWLEVARQCCTQNQTSETISTCHQILKHQPDVAEAYQMLGDALQALEKFESACRAYLKASEIKPHWAELHMSLGRLQERQGQLEPAIESYKAALALKPEFALVYWHLSLLKQQGQVEEAFACQRIALELQPNLVSAQVHLDLGRTFWDRGQVHEAINSYRKAIALQPDWAEAYESLGDVLQQQGSLTEAIQSYQHALELKPDLVNVRVRLETACIQQSQLNCDVENAQQYIEKGNTLIQAGQLEAAIRSYQQAIALQPKFALAYWNLGNLLRHQGRLQESLNFKQQAISLNPDFAALEIHFNLGETLAQQGQRERAIDCYCQALKIKPDWSESRLKMTELLTGYMIQSSPEVEVNRGLLPSQAFQVNWTFRAKQFGEKEIQDFATVMNEDGIVVIPDYWQREQCLLLKEKLEKLVIQSQTNQEFEGGAYLRKWFLLPKDEQKNYDRGVSRIYHLDKLIPDLISFKQESWILKVLQLYSGRQFYSKNLWYQYNEGCYNTRYFHVDMFALRSQIKSFLYLEDVSQENGPFCYIKGSHNDLSLIRQKFYSTTPPGQDSGYTEAELKHIINKATPIIATAGSLIIADVGGAHRGLPQQNKSRSILMQYYMDSSGEIYDEL